MEYEDVTMVKDIEIALVEVAQAPDQKVLCLALKGEPLSVSRMPLDEAADKFLLTAAQTALLVESLRPLLPNMDMDEQPPH